MWLRKNVVIATREHAILRIVKQVERGVVTALLACIARKYQEKQKDCNMFVSGTGCQLIGIPLVADHAVAQKCIDESGTQIKLEGVTEASAALLELAPLQRRYGRVDEAL